MKHLDIIPECYVDTNLVESLLGFCGQFTDGVNHQKGCNTVAKTMKSKFADRFALGVIDDDKRRMSYLNEFAKIAQSEHLTLFKHNSHSHYIVLVTPAMDTFIMTCAQEAKVNMNDYGLPSELKQLTKVTKSVNTKNDNRFKCLFKDIRNTREIVIFTKVLAYLCEHRYDAQLQVLSSYFEKE